MTALDYYRRTRRFCYDVLHNTDYDTPASRYFNYLLIIMIIANVSAVLVESVDHVYQAHAFYFDRFEHISIAVFTIEYLLRLWSVVEEDLEIPAWKQRSRWLLSGAAIVDFLAIFPAYLNFFVHMDLSYLRILRLLRLLKLTRYFVSLQILLNVIEREKGSFQAVIFILIIMIVLAAGGVYAFEHNAQPDVFGSIPQAMWWAVVTLTTVGYGDVTPVTNAGKILGSVIMVLGVGLAALPAGILATGLANELNVRKERLEQEFRELIIEKDLDLVNDQTEVEKIGRAVGLRKEQIHEILVQLMREQVLEEQERELKHYKYCPHCGGKLHD
ncbi:ion transporter [Acinetobacter sp. ANC 4633]|uniref:ion transporter n=1 Tax=Acinetobacter sp. ANC 4633 TaxID=2529845 RepID=UPI00103DA10C|nr:ion transporter [Acinetobacter sp. ANC 4633]TCB27735.1 ion transporter [Acinetobacter sp. ANC 4633]